MSSPIQNVLVVAKQSARQAHPAGLSRRLGRRSGRRWVEEEARRIQAASAAHQKNLRQVLESLRKRQVRFKVVHRTDRSQVDRYDGMIAVGGDGTFLEAARSARSIGLLGINSDPERSVGSFCRTTAQDFKKKLNRFLAGEAPIRRLHRLELLLNGKQLDRLVLNDLLVTHAKPAAMSRYWIEVGRRAEEQRSSGLWVATAAGSTGAIRSAGGRLLPKGSKRLQYRPRELYSARRKRYRLRGAVLPEGHSLQIGSLMQEGLICVDGEHHVIAFPHGSVLKIRFSKHPLRWLIL